MCLIFLLPEQTISLKCPVVNIFVAIGGVAGIYHLFSIQTMMVFFICTIFVGYCRVLTRLYTQAYDGPRSGDSLKRAFFL